MILLDKPYVSDFLFETIEKNNFPVIRTSVSEEMTDGKLLNLISSDEVIREFKKSEIPLLYTNSENSISWIETNLAFTSIPEKIKIFKDKVMFRKLTKDKYPDIFFKEVRLDDIKELDVTDYQFPFVIKPSVGFFSLGVYQVDSLKEWDDTVIKLFAEIDKYSDLYPEEVLNISNFIIEGFISGDEYAVDCYYDKDGKPVVLNIFKHLFSDGKDVSDRVYMTSKKIIQDTIHEIENFLSYIGELTGLVRFPIHIEVRIDSNGILRPVEINPLRFGGWCTTADFTWYSNGYNSYEYFFNQSKPDWEKVFKKQGDNIFSMCVLNNSTGTDGSLIESFDYEKLLAKFRTPLLIRKSDFKKFPLFGFLFLETHPDDYKEIDWILRTDLKEFIT